MAPLENDCFALGGDLMPLDRALDALAAKLRPVTGTETVPLRDALNRVLAETVTAERDVPPYDNAAVDGYAVFFDDLEPEAETRLPVTGHIAAGHPLDRAARPGEALRIFTGAPVPDGPDTVVMQEDCRVEADHVILAPGIRRGANRRRRGEDVRSGDAILAPGIRLRPQEIGLAASVGRVGLTVRKRLQDVQVLELAPLAQTAAGGCLFHRRRGPRPGRGGAPRLHLRFQPLYDHGPARRPGLRDHRSRRRARPP